MKLGNLYPLDEEKLQEDGVSLGIDLLSLMDSIYTLEVKHANSSQHVLAELKYHLGVAAGKLAPIEEEENGVEKQAQ